MSILGIDPGIDTGWCLVDDAGQLVSCGLGEVWPAADVAVIERPHVYRSKHMKGDPNDLITLAIRVGRYQERLSVAKVPTVLVEPSAWKGQIDKDVHHPRIWANLSHGEKMHVQKCLTGAAKGKIHNVFDGIGLAKYLHRLKVSGAAIRYL